MYDSSERTWRHLNFFEHKTLLHARQPRVECPDHGVKTVEVPWARPGSGFTLLMEAFILLLVQGGMTAAQAARLIDEHDTRVWRVLQHYVEQARAEADFSKVTAVGVDETSRHRLDAVGILTIIDGNALARYCHLWARWRRAEDFIKEKGDIYPLKDADGNVKYWQQWPQVSIAHRLSQQLTKLKQEFCLTPASRPRITVVSPATRSGIARFFRMPDDDEERFFGTN
ncbi:MAG: P27 family phage terminase small subunit [Planctomycetes bacterium]|nr:P27 family phage terminase small subunit [Planctomycetota bacterium]